MKTVKEIAELMGLDKSQVLRQIQAGYLKATLNKERVPVRWEVEEGDFSAWQATPRIVGKHKSVEIES